MKVTIRVIEVLLIILIAVLFYKLGYDEKKEELTKAMSSMNRLDIMYQTMKDANEFLYNDIVRLESELNHEHGQKNDWMNFAKSTWDYELMCRLVEAEAGNQDIPIKTKVSTTILNRVAYPGKFGDNVMEVMIAKGQFTPMSDGSAYDEEVTEETYIAVDDAIVSKQDKDLLFFMTPAVAAHQAYFRSLNLIEQTEDLNFYGFHEEEK